MLTRFFIILTLLFNGFANAQNIYERQVEYNDSVFDTAFFNIAKGEFKGSINGLLLVQKNNKETVLDFQGSAAILKLIPDIDRVYDVSFKQYTGFTSSGKTKVVYTTYAYANSLSITLDNTEYSVGIIDGACDSIIKNLKFHYIRDANTEYLILTITKPILLDDFFSKMEAGSITGADDINYKKQSIKLIPNSIIVFVINKNPFK